MIKGPLTEPDLGDFVTYLRKKFSKKMNCVQVGQIKSYSAALATASIQIVVKRNAIDRIVSYPLLVNCPVFLPYGGTGSLYFPIAAGDYCIVLFSDRNIDTWHTYGNEAEPATDRTHDLSDGIALVGIYSLVAPPAARAASETGLVDNAVRVSLASNKANIENATKSLLGLIEGLIDVLKTISVDSGTHVINAASIAALEAQKAEFQALLYKD